VKGEHLCIDISYVSESSYAGSKFWLLIMDDCTGMLWSKFLKNKSDTAEKVIKLIKEFKSQSLKVKYIRCDNAGENQSLKQQCDQEGLGVNFEFTARATPQHNGRIERMFQTLCGRVKSMLNQAGLPSCIRQGVWAEAANMAVFMGKCFGAYQRSVACLYTVL